MLPIVPTSAIAQALQEVPLILPNDAVGFGWVVNKDLVRRLEQFGPLRSGVHEMAASAIADVTAALLDSPLAAGGGERILLLAGPGGNGADGLRTGRVLAERGHRVDVLVLPTENVEYPQDYPGGSANQRLLAELVASGATHITPGQVIEEDINRHHGVVLEALVGSGFRGVLNGLLATWAQASAWGPCVAVDIPAGVVADTGETPPLRDDLGELRHPPTVTVALGGLREAHRSDHCGTVVLATCGLEPGDRSYDRFLRLIPPEPGFEWPDSVDTMVRDGGRSVDSRWREVRRRSVGVVIGETGCLGFGLLALQTLRGAGTWHHLSLVAAETTAARIIAQHPDVAVHLDLVEAVALTPETWVVGTDHVPTLEQVLRRGEQVILGPRASATVAGQGLLQALRERTGKTVMVTRNTGLAGFGDTAEIIGLSDGVIQTSRPESRGQGKVVRNYLDPVVPVGQVQGIEAVLAGMRAVTDTHNALVLLADRMQRRQSQWPVSAAQLAVQGSATS